MWYAQVNGSDETNTSSQERTDGSNPGGNQGFAKFLLSG
ncbi:hypothetical protein STRIP9103_07925 [Streptomyces ipomoeae 91-03]|uniref:Uncharacterized protein n=1 Tax=Streptomyces ipomoeae 91-03 TaxID=698759 RepID=L1L8Y2_9ACTN|nr:hypothetical protein STRIP9103_07925 [Streptomyces ipomoeae 91-03]